MLCHLGYHNCWTFRRSLQLTMFLLPPPNSLSPVAAGEFEYRRGAFDAAFAHLRTSVRLDDDLPFDEPWGWMQPTRHALGALLLEQVWLHHVGSM